MKTNIYLIRHATPDWNQKATIYHLPPGPSLTSQGRSEAYALGQYLKQVGVSRLYSSPLERCLETARIAGEGAGSGCVIDDRLTEWQPGEDPATVQNRMVEVMESTLGESSLFAEGETVSIGLVSHGGPIGALLERIGMGSEELKTHRIYDHKNPLPPAAVWRLSRDEEGRAWKMELDFIPEVSLA